MSKASLAVQHLKKISDDTATTTKAIHGKLAPTIIVTLDTPQIAAQIAAQIRRRDRSLL